MNENDRIGLDRASVEGSGVEFASDLADAVKSGRSRAWLIIALGVVPAIVVVAVVGIAVLLS